jgi:hypothetical protein
MINKQEFDEIEELLDEYTKQRESFSKGHMSHLGFLAKQW